MMFASPPRYIVSLVCAVIFVAGSIRTPHAQQIFPNGLFPLFRGLGEREVPPPGQRQVRAKPPNGTAQPSFDCRRVKLAAERAICSNADLAALDRAMAESYGMARRANPGQAAVLKAQQRRYVARRNACGGSADCLRQAMLDQIASLDPARASVDPEGSVAGPAVNADGSVPVASQDQAIATPPVFAPISCNPPPGNGSRFVCTNANLLQLDARMAATVAAILGSNTAPSDFEATQTSWVAERDNCANDTCLSSLYGKRLAELADFVPSSSPPDLASPEAIAETQRIATNWSIPLLRGRLYLPKLDLVNLYIGKNQPPAMNAWKKFLLAAGLAAEPDLAAHYNDDSLMLIACTLLDDAVLSDIGGEKICRTMYMHASNSGPPGQYLRPGDARQNFPGGEFATHDFVQRFKADYLPKIVASAPRPPFQIVIVDHADVSDYDMSAGLFRLSTRSDEERGYQVLGSSTDLVLKKLVWPLPEKAARKFVAGQQESSYGAFVAIPMTISGAARDDGYSTNGLPSGYRWKIDAGDPVLYDDQRLTTRLYAFPPQARLPHVMPDSEGKVRLYGDVPLDDETMMLVLLKNGIIAPDGIDWQNAAASRYDDEDKFRRRTDWQSVDPWGLWFAERPNNNPQLIQRFKDWTIRRAAALPDKVVLRQYRYFAASQDGLRALGSERGYVSSDTSGVVDNLSAKGGGVGNLLDHDFRIPATIGSIYAASPLPGSAYVLKTDAPDPSLPAILETALQLGSVEAIGTTTLLHVTPLSASLRIGDQMISTVVFLPPADQDAALAGAAAAAAAARQAAIDKTAAEVASAEAAKAAVVENAAAERRAADAAVRTAAADYLSGKVSGPDVLGVQLGMSLEEAEATLRKAFDVGWELEMADNRGNFDALEHLRILVSTDQSEYVALLLPHDDEPQQVIGVERIVLVPPTVPVATIRKMVEAKYGAPAEADAGGLRWLWTTAPQELSGCGLTTALAHDMKVVSGPAWNAGLREQSLTMRTPAGGPNVDDLSAWANCRPVVSVTRNHDYVTSALWDMRALVTVASSKPDGTDSEHDEPDAPVIKF